MMGIVGRYYSPVALPTICVTGKREIVIPDLLSDMARPNHLKTSTKTAGSHSNPRGDQDTVFHIRASYVSCSFVIVGRVVLGILFGPSQGSRSCESWLGFLCDVFHLSSCLFFSFLRANI